jgi:hypothetical protein
MYLLHYLPESNLLNPAVPVNCKWYVGLPVISSVHVNYANSSFSYKQVFTPAGNGTYETNIDEAVKRLHYRNFTGTEAHVQLFALGYRKNDYSFVFTLTEKNNAPLTYPKEPVLLAWEGNTQFEGNVASFKGSGVYFTHYREYALGLSKHVGNGVYYGIRGKLLFGKLNISSRNTDIDLFTDATSFNLNFNGEMLVRSSLPINASITGNQVNIEYNDNISVQQLLFNRKNPGFAIDAGIIYPFNDKTELSASIIDLGFIRWRSNLNVFKASGDFTYTGPLNDSLISDTYFEELVAAFTDSMNMEVTPQKYTSFLPPRILAGATYRLNDNVLLGLQGEAIFYKTKIIPSLTLSGQFEPVNNVHLIASYSLQYYQLKSLGLGLVFGQGPIQYYILSDDVPGMIWPLSARNINLRFGVNINLGCTTKPPKSGSGKGQVQGNCYWLEKQIQKDIKKAKRKK